MSESYLGKDTSFYKAQAVRVVDDHPESLRFLFRFGDEAETVIDCKWAVNACGELDHCQLDMRCEAVVGQSFKQAQSMLSAQYGRLSGVDKTE